jgi:phosphatidylglycerol---prolipoprotein diacylglyceryl transferase
MFQGDVMAIPSTQTKARTPAGRSIHHRLAWQTTLWLGAFALLFGYFLLRYVVLKQPILPPYTVGPLTFTPFGTLVALGILFGIHLTRCWCGRLDLDRSTMQAAVTWVMGTGLVTAHLLAVGEASPARLLNPSALLAMRSDFSSFGGLLGSTLAVLYFCKRRALAVRPVGDALLYGIIGGWLFGRLGCFAVHDHPGEVTALPTGVFIQGALRHDLGFYELVYTLVLFTAITVAIRTRKRFDGFVVAVTATSYSVVRFCLDFLRVGDVTYAGLTLAQWGCLPLFGLGVYTLLSGWNRRIVRVRG